jgi:hypothetical protein
MTSMGFDIAKAGWLHRRTSVLHRWKKNWFALDRNGDLRYFETPDDPRAEERIVVRASVMEVIARNNFSVPDSPEGLTSKKDCFLELRFRDREPMLLCAESFDDMKAWQISLEEARTMNVNPAPQQGMRSTTTIVTPPGYTHYANSYGAYDYPGQVICQNPQLPATQVVYSPNVSTTTVIGVAPPSQQIVYVDDGPWRHRRYYRGFGYGYSRPLFFW